MTKDPAIETRRIIDRVQHQQMTPEEGFESLKDLESESMGRLVYHPVWESRPVDPNRLRGRIEGNLLIFDCDQRLFNTIETGSSDGPSADRMTFLVTPGTCFRQTAPNAFTVRPDRSRDYRRLISALAETGKMPAYILHLWSRDPYIANEQDLKTQLARGILSVFHLTRALMDRKPDHEIRLLFGYEETGDRLAPQFSAVSGFAKTVRLENPKFRYKTVAFADRRQILDLFTTEFHLQDGVEVRYDAGNRYVRRMRASVPMLPGKGGTVFKEGGVYLLTGGAGSVGRIIAGHIARQVKARIIIAGRSRPAKALSAKLQTLEHSGSKILYMPSDVSQREDVEALVDDIRSRFHRLDGVIHCAGVIRDDFILKKKTKNFLSVLKPKILGAVHLDHATRDDRLDFFVFFSSISSVTGNSGQCDYAVANTFLDHFADLRNNRVASRNRWGRTVSINWPFWQEGGMRIDEEKSDRLTEKTGMLPLPADDGLAAFEDAVFRYRECQHLVLYGNKKQLQTFMSNPEPAVQNRAHPSAAGVGKSRTGKIERLLRQVLSDLLKWPVERIEPDINLEEFGIDSIIVNQFNDRMEAMIGPLPKTLLFECQTVSDLAGIMAKDYSDQLDRLFSASGENASMPDAVDANDGDDRAAPGPPVTERLVPVHAHAASDAGGGIAVIGVSCRFPKAQNMDAFWENLRQGRDCVTEIPEDRWDYRSDYHPDPSMSRQGKSYCKWGAFLEGVEHFDAPFFKISPREAEVMDPQERLFLESCWSVLEDAGYTRHKLKPFNVGVYAGVTTHTYMLWGPDLHRQAKGDLPISMPWSIANRVSYLFDFHGPSLPVDTACSSSLVAVHMACESLKRGECDVALAGGVNLYLHPLKYVLLCRGQMLSPKGRCSSFGIDADGFVPGEGVGTVLLKPLKRAVRDQDYIYGVIKGSAINHGGRTSGYTVPNPNAQAALIRDALRSGGIDPRTVSYMEAHGTGTDLGDPVEIRGLTRAFRKYSRDRQYCAIGSVKSNIGHLESAAGIAGLIKILLQFRHRQLTPSLHCGTLNPKIDFKDSPFYVQQDLSEWKQPNIRTNGREETLPRRAGLSSFGAGGANAHVVIEEYIECKEQRAESPSEVGSSFHGVNIGKEPAGPHLIVLSAKNEDRLKVYAKAMVDYIDSIVKEEIQNPKSKIENIAYTLQVGREAMDERLAVIVSSIKDLEVKLKGFLEDQKDIPDLFRGQVKHNKETLAVFTADEELQEAIGKWIQRGKYAKLLNFWVKGLVFDWNKLYGDIKPYKPRRISLPTYPFERKRYWISEDTGRGTSGSVKQINPLLHQNTSDLSEQRFSSTFTGREFFLSDHVVNGQRVLPGVAYIEMARAAVDLSAGGLADSQLEEDYAPVRLKNVIWTRPIAVGDAPVRVHIGLFPEENGQIAYEIYSETEENSAEFIVHGQGSVALLSASEVSEVPKMDLPALQVRCNHSNLNSSQCYDAFSAMGIDYGPAHRGIEKVLMGSGQVLAELSLPSSVSNTQDQFVLHPSLMDSALQASIGLTMVSESAAPNGEDSLRPSLPFVLKQIDILGKCTSKMWALIQYGALAEAAGNAKTLDIDLCDDQGKICVRMKGFSSRSMETKRRPGDADKTGLSPKAAIGTLMFHPYWKEKAIPEEAADPVYTNHLVMLCEPSEVTKQTVETQMEGVRCLVLQTKRKDTSSRAIAKRFRIYTIRVFEEIRRIIEDKPKERTLIQVVVSVQGEQQLFSGITGMLKTARLENPKIFGQLIETDPGGDSEAITEKLKKCSRCPNDIRIRYQNGKSWVVDWREVEFSKEAVSTPWRDRGIYLITGGTGGLGLLFAEEIARQTENATLILTGRTELSEDKKDSLKELSALGAGIEYKQVDVSREKAVTALIQDIRKDFGSLHGIIHSAGVIRDNYILNKTKEELEDVLAPKVAGVLNLDRASRNLPLDFFIFFSSGAGIMGNPGQADYSAANAFMDAYSGYRNNLVASKQRHGQTLSINWPLWKEGGMQVDEETEKMIWNSTGMIAMRTATGIHALYQALASGKEQVIVMEGDPAKMKQKLLSNKQRSATAALTTQESKKTPAVAYLATEIDDTLQDKVQTALKQSVSELLKVKVGDIDIDSELNEYGFDSITLTELTNKLNRDYRIELVPTIFFEYTTIRSFVKYLIEEQRGIKAATFKLRSSIELPVQAMEDSVGSVSSVKRRRSRFAYAVSHSALKSDTVPEPLAIVGMAGRFPMAKDVNEFWKNMIEGRDCIEEIPGERWDWRAYYGDPKKEANKTNIKWGGFIDGIQDFDPLFFGISPREAMHMDPQQRLLLIHVWKAIEDAGYSARDLSGTNTAIFVGTANSGYSGLIALASEAIEGHSSTGSVPSVGPNRMSYFLNLHGPSEPIETACSSSLIAVHRGMEAIKSGTCDMAIVGGVNTIILPDGHISFNKAGMLCEDGRCKTFSDKANGYVRGEGVGMIFIKRLKAAEEAGDHVYGVIRATAENHGGRANSLTAPNPKAQAELLKAAYTKAGIDPRSIGYIETHGTGTELGDPIEINGLKAAFEELSQADGDHRGDTAFCGLGSVKSHIGHLELAAGIAGVIKVLLQLKHKTLVKSLHCDTINPYIKLENSPFYIVRENKEWKPLQDSEGKDLPRRAGVSSFGFGGANAHVVVEEYVENGVRGEGIGLKAQSSKLKVESATVRGQESVKGERQVIVLSAKNEDRLKACAAAMVDYFASMDKKEIQNPKSKIQNIAYTLQVGREAMEERLAVISGSLEDLRDRLCMFAAGKEHDKRIFRGRVGEETSGSSPKMDEASFSAFVGNALKNRALDELARLWVAGWDVNWRELHTDSKPKRISLPTYPFATERYWISGKSNYAITHKLHPLIDGIDARGSLENGVVFKKILKKTDPIVDHYRVRHQRLMPGDVFVEMGYAAGRLIHPDKRFKLTGMRWRKPMAVETDQKEIRIVIRSESDYLTFQVQGREGDQVAVYASGNLHPDPSAGTSSEGPVSIEEIKARCTHQIDRETFYRRFQEMGVIYHEYFKGVLHAWGNRGESLCRLHLPEAYVGELESYTFHPTLTDSALQAISGLNPDQNLSDQPLKVHFAIEEAEMLRPLSADGYAYVKAMDSDRFDIAVLDAEGRICIRFLHVRVGEIPDPLEGFFFKPRWVPLLSKPAEAAAASDASMGAGKKRILIVYSPESLGLEKALAAFYPGDTVHKVRLGIRNRQYSKQAWEVRTSDAEALDHCVSRMPAMDSIFFLGAIQSRGVDSNDPEALAPSQERGILSLFRLVKSLIRGNRMSTCRELTVLTNDVYRIDPDDVVNPLAGSLNGFTRGIAREYPHLSASCIDIRLKDISEKPSLKKLKRLLTPIVAGTYRIETTALRDGRWYEQKIDPVRVPFVFRSPFRDRGVYFILGGGGGIGLELGLYLARTVHARLALIGRREPDAHQQTKMADMEKAGGEVLYFRADAVDEAQMQKAVSAAKSRFGPINGVVHSAIVLNDRSLRSMNEDALQNVLAPKVRGSVVLHKVFKGEPLDFMLFFSSLQSLAGNAGQSNYAAACTFKDGFAHYLCRQVDYPVKVMNWGYWGSVGIASDLETRQRMASHGVGSVEPEEGMEGIRRVLLSPMVQTATFRVAPEVLETLGIEQGTLLEKYADRNPSVFETVIPQIKQAVSTLKKPSGTERKIPREEKDRFIARKVTETFIHILSMGDRVLNTDTPYTDYGVDSIMAIDIIDRLNSELGIELRTTDLFNYPTLRQLSRYIMEAHGNAIDDRDEKQMESHRLDKSLPDKPIDAGGATPEAADIPEVHSDDAVLDIFDRLKTGDMDVGEAYRLLGVSDE